MRSVLVLDFDGTVLDTERPAYLSWREIWAEHGEELTVEGWARRIGHHHELDALAELEERLGRSLDPALRDRRLDRKAELTDLEELRPGVLAWLDEAAELGVPVGIASSSPSWWVLGNLEKRGLRDRFGAVSCCEDGVRSKPDPASYVRAIEQLGGDPAASVAVEDSASGVAAAVAAGLWTVAVPHGLTRHLDLSAAHRIVDSLEELSLRDALAAARRRGSPPSPPR